MQKNEHITQFSYRLRDAMIQAGFRSTRSPSGIDIKKLQEITGYSIQICRKYIRGEALPEISKIITIANFLKVSPGWLLFGNETRENEASQYINIRKALLYHIFYEVLKYRQFIFEHDDISELLLSLTNDISHIQAPDDELIKIIELTLSSTFNYRKRKGASS